MNGKTIPSKSFPDIANVFSEIKDAPPRAAVLVAVSMLELALEMAIKAHLRAPYSSRAAKALDGELFSSLSQKIWAAYFLNIIGPKTCSDMHIARQIRNECAHTTGPISFDISPISDWLLSMDALTRIFSHQDATRGERFLHITASMATTLIMKASIKSGQANGTGSPDIAYQMMLNP